MRNKNRSTQRVLILSFCVSLLFVFTFAASSALEGQRARKAAQKRERAQKERPRERDRKAQQQQQPRETPEPKQPQTPAAVSDAGAASDLGRNIERAIADSEFAFARWGVAVVSLRDGRVIYARDADKTFTPASNMKVYTTAVALDMLGADYRWRTSVYAEREPDREGTITGDIILYGRGAPDLKARAERGGAPNHLAQLADELYKRGVRRVRGNVVGDESYFRGEPLGDGWLWNDVQWYFGAEVSALTVNSNETTLTITSAKKTDEPVAVRVDTAGDYFHVINDTRTASPGAPLTIGVTRGLSDNDVRVWGDFGAGGRSYSVRLSVHKPALWAADLFRDALRERGITVDGEARLIDARSRADDQTASSSGVELASINSRTLGEIVRPTNKESLNLNAELILRTLGKERGSLAPDPNPATMRMRGDDQAGTALVRLWLERAGIHVATLALHDGSGLSRLDRITPDATARLLAAIAKTPSANIFRDSLPIAGRDGTLRSRLNRVSGRILAKTGTLTYTNSLSGYATTADNEPVAFSIICNDETIKDSSTEVIDAIAVLLTEYSEK
ncbi:MAG TPA: D-alanyl-D-alanine carboxypeptidase/D-alanyl-D-alanine-endopeptidase [Pyrinomonadaceae bacterium]|jgi:D-alanyl-D-alanine carboxypeptidase/D-alanyl-D-alanine-endopeptidase (penicillin-binding protein 4)